MLNDPKLIGRIEEEIRQNLQAAEAAVARAAIEFHNALKASEAPSVRDKAADVMDVGQRLVSCLDDTATAESPKADVIVASSIVPSQLVRYAHHGVVAIITETCGAKSHTAILARGLGIPMVTGIEGAAGRIRDGAPVVIDAGAGIVIVDPSQAEEDAVAAIRSARSAPPQTGLKAVPKGTCDGVPVNILLNISDPIEAENAADVGLAGVGLFRTEFLYMDRASWPSEDESFETYERVAHAIGDGELNIRLADFGAEKSPAYADIPVNRNPSLGVRGVRLLLSRPDILEPQVRALARLARLRPVTVLLPMIDTLDTLLRIQTELDRICGIAQGAALPFRLGTMIEVPSAALLIEEVIDRVDSVAVGLNDLTQYLLAADRDDEFVESYHDALAARRAAARASTGPNSSQSRQARHDVRRTCRRSDVDSFDVGAGSAANQRFAIACQSPGRRLVRAICCRRRSARQGRACLFDRQRGPRGAARSRHAGFVLKPDRGRGRVSL